MRASLSECLFKRRRATGSSGYAGSDLASFSASRPFAEEIDCDSLAASWLVVAGQSFLVAQTSS